MKNWRNLAFVITFSLFTTPSVSFADDSALMRGLIGGIFQTMQQQAQQPPAYNGDAQQFRVEDEAAERLHFRQEIQRRLNLLGYKAGYPDGRFGPQARSAIAAFQSDIGRKATGKITENEIAILYEKTNNPAVVSIPQQNAKPIQPTAVVSEPPEKQQQETAPIISLEPVERLEPASAPAPASVPTNSSANAPKAAANNDDAPISIQPTLALPSGK